MSNAVVQIKRPDHAAEERQDPLHAERASLQTAIAAEAEARRAVEIASGNLKRGHAAVDSVRAELSRAERLVEAAMERDSRAAAASIRKSASAPSDASKTVRGARLRAQELGDDVEIAEAAIERLQDDVAQAEAAVLRCVVDTMAARSSVLAPVCRELIARARDAHRSYALSRALLIELLNDPSKGAPDFPDDTLDGARARERIAAPLAGLRDEAERATMMGNRTAEEDSAAAASAVAAMRQAISGLTADAATDLPPLP